MDSNTRHKWPRWSKVLSNLMRCLLSSGSNAISFFKICISFNPALYLGSVVRTRIRKGRWCLHRFLSSDNLNGNFLPNFPDLRRQDSCSDDIGEHALAQRRENLIFSAIQLFTKDDLIVAFGVRSSIQGCCHQRGGGCFLGQMNKFKVPLTVDSPAS